MNRIQAILTFAIIGGFIGLTLALQFKSGVPKESSYPLDQIEIQKTLLESFTNDQQKLELRLNELRKQYDETTQKLEKGISKKQRQLLDELKELSGAAEVNGSGVEVFLADSALISRDAADPQDEALVHAADLRDLFNLLFSAGAEAISVNGRRILPFSSVNVIGNTFVIQDFYSFPPFTIQAVGRPEVLQSRLRDESILADLQKRVRTKKIRFTSQEREELAIPAFSGVFHTQYLALPSTKNP